MHDPLTQAFQIKYPWRDRPSKGWPEGYRRTFITIWHRDPEKDGTDDSCGWFKRCRHGNREHLERITKGYEQDWKYWFNEDGSPIYSVLSTVLSMAHVAARVHFDRNYDKADRFMRRHLYSLMFFAENPFDSLHCYVTNKYGAEPKERRIEHFASVMYGWILRADQKWWQHARWHVHHWSVQVHPWQQLRRRFWDRCCKCGKRGFPKGVSAIGDWSGKRIWHDTCGETAGAAAQVAKTAMK